MATSQKSSIAAAAAFLSVTVRDGFVVVFTEKVKQGDKIVAREQAYYPEDGVVELTPERVLEHAHKLEPADDTAKAFMEKLHVKFEAPAAAGGVDVAAIAAQAASSAVAATLAALGLDAAALQAAIAAKQQPASKA